MNNHIVVIQIEHDAISLEKVQKKQNNLKCLQMKYI